MVGYSGCFAVLRMLAASRSPQGVEPLRGDYGRARNERRVAIGVFHLVDSKSTTPTSWTIRRLHVSVLKCSHYCTECWANQHMKHWCLMAVEVAFRASQYLESRPASINAACVLRAETMATFHQSTRLFYQPKVSPPVSKPCLKMSSLVSGAADFAFKRTWRPLERALQFFFRFFYHEMLKHTTTESLKATAQETNPHKSGSLFREWSRVESNESKYIQIAV